MRFPNLFSWGRPQLTEEQAQKARIDAKLRSIESQGAGSVFFAHGLAYLLVVAFSAGSLITLAGDAINHFITQAHAGVVDIPSLISFIVSFALVFAMDTAMVIAASNVRMHKQRNQPGMWTHVAMIAGVCLVESATYLYMSYVYDHPVSAVAWAILTARAIAAPIVAVYLSLSRTLPISARDIVTQVEVVTGRGVLVDMTRIADDPTATTERKTALYTASATMIEADAKRFANLIAAERTTRDGSVLEGMPANVSPFSTLPSAASAASASQFGVAALPTQHQPQDFRPSYQPSAKPLSVREQRRQALIASMDPEGFGQRGHPTSPRSGAGVTLDDDSDEFGIGDWDREDAAVLNNYELPEMRMHSGKRDRTQAARVAPRGAELVIAPAAIDLPPSRYERENDTDECRRVLRVLDNDENASMKTVMRLADVSDGTVRKYRALWNDRRAKKGRRKAAPRTEELSAITTEMLAPVRE